MIIRLPQGYETQIGEGGASCREDTVSGSRLPGAVFARPTSSSLDEPRSSNLDADGDRALSDRCAIELKRRQTDGDHRFHLPSTLANVDKILLLRGNRAVEAFGMRNEIVARLNQRATSIAVATE